jgi:hypothetical protein
MAEMKPLPDLDDTDAMLLRGKRSALASARNEADIALRDAYTVLQGADWPEVQRRAAEVSSLAMRIQTIASIWESLK